MKYNNMNTMNNMNNMNNIKENDLKRRLMS